MTSLNGTVWKINDIEWNGNIINNSTSQRISKNAIVTRMNVIPGISLKETWRENIRLDPYIKIEASFSNWSWRNGIYEAVSIKLAQNKEQWHALVKEIMEVRLLQKIENLTS